MSSETSPCSSSEFAKSICDAVSGSSRVPFGVVGGGIIGFSVGDSVGLSEGFAVGKLEFPPEASPDGVTISSGISLSKSSHASSG